MAHACYGRDSECYILDLLSVVDQMMKEYADELSPLGPGLDLSKYQGVPRGHFQFWSDGELHPTEWVAGEIEVTK